MSEYQRHTDFLRRCVLYDKSARHLELIEGITRIQCNAHCVRRAVWLIMMLTALTLVALGYAAIMTGNFPDGMPQSIINIICGLGIGWLISLSAFMMLLLHYRLQLNERREECRELVVRLLESHLGKAGHTPF
ncbi:MAG TPA: hypothetical protein VFC07_10960 [Verrucomicrobiae bacterium]|nr:hypothetical protein [Verrucomicrobiae bacterium]